MTDTCVDCGRRIVTDHRRGEDTCHCCFHGITEGHESERDVDDEDLPSAAEKIRERAAEKIREQDEDDADGEDGEDVKRTDARVIRGEVGVRSSGSGNGTL